MARQGPQWRTRGLAAARVSTNLGDRGVTGKLYIQDDELGALLDKRRDYREGADIQHRHAQQHPDGTGCADTLATAQARANQHAEWMNAAQRRWKEVLDLDQVFIAV